MENLTTGALEASGDPKNFSALNCIDLSSPEILNSVSSLKQACLDSGFFYVINHGISQEFMDEVFYQSKSFFDLPVSEKMKVLRNKQHRGYTPLFDEHLDPVNQMNGDYKEGYYIGIEVPENDPDIEKPLYGPNVWPTADILPGWRETMEKYHREALEVAKAVSRIIALALDLEVDFFDRQEMLGKPIATLRLLHYEGRVSDPMKGIYGAGAHSDFGLITLLATDDVYGLQICRDKDAKPQKWEFVAPLKGAFIVNLGDMLERWSNCIFRSTLHRVLGNGQERYSIAYFVEPSHDCVVECLPTCQSQENPAKLPNASDLEIFSMYGVGIPTERAYIYKLSAASECYIPFQIDTSAKGGHNCNCLKGGVFSIDGDETVPALSAGFMAAKGWRGKTRFNPSGIPTYLREYNHAPPSNLLEGRGTQSGAHVDIMGNFALIEDVIRVAAGATGEDLGGDQVHSDIFKWSEKINLQL